MLKTYPGSCHCGGVRPFGIGTETPIGRMYGGGCAPAAKAC